MPNININSFQRFSDLIIAYLIVLQALSSATNDTKMRVTCGTDIELICPIGSMRNSDEVISWFRPSSTHSYLTFIAIGDILFPEYATIGRFNLISSSSISRLIISNVLIEDQGVYTCKSSSSGQHSITLLVESYPYIFPSSPLLLYPVNQTFSITCSLLCHIKINPNDLNWFVNRELIYNDNYNFNIETISSNTQRLTVYLNKKRKSFNQANYTCKFNENESTILVRQHTREQLQHLTREHISSSAHLFQMFDKGQTQCSISNMTVFCFLLLLRLY